MTDNQTTRGNGTRSKLASATDELSSAAKTVKNDATRLADTAKEELRHRTESVKEDVKARAEEGKSVAAEGLETFAAAIRKAGEDLKDHDQTTTARLVSEAANGLEGFSRLLNEKSIDGVVDSVRSFARANPTAFVAGSVLAGVALGRFIRSSSHHAPSNDRNGYGKRDRAQDSNVQRSGSSFEEDSSYQRSSGSDGGSSWTGPSGQDRTRQRGDGLGEGELP